MSKLCIEDVRSNILHNIISHSCRIEKKKMKNEILNQKSEVIVGFQKDSERRLRDQELVGIK